MSNQCFLQPDVIGYPTALLGDAYCFPSLN